MSTAPSFERLTEYFQSSGFEYMALECAGTSLTLSRGRLGQERPAHARATSAVTTTRVLASSVGVVELPDGRQRFAEAGEPVIQGEALFAIRRFRRVVAVAVPASGTVASVLVRPGDFVEFGQPLAMLRI